MANLDSIDLSISKGTLNEIDGSILDGQDVISTERLHKNDTLMGTYKVLSGPIKGGMGSVWCVRHLEDGNIMAMGADNSNMTLTPACPSLKEVLEL